MWNIKGTGWNSTQNIILIHWKMCSLSRSENLRGLRFTSSSMFLKRPPVQCQHIYIGLKRYAQPTIRYDTRYGAHDTICSEIHLPFLAGKQRLVITACDQKHRTEPTTAACTVINDSQWLQQWPPPPSFQMQCVFYEFTHVIGIYWLLSALSCVCFLIWYVLQQQLYRIISYLPQSVSRYVP